MVGHYAFLLFIPVIMLAACSPGPKLSPQQQADQFCQVLATVNQGRVDTTGLPELEGHTAVLQALLDVAPLEIAKDMAIFHAVFEIWASAVSGETSMVDNFAEMTAPSLVSAEGRIGDYIAEHCGLRLGDGSWREAERPTAQSFCPGWPRIGSPLTFNNFPNYPDIAGSNYFANEYFVSRLGLAINDAFPVEPGGKVRMHGQYPKARYFAYHPNDQDLNNLATLRDRDLAPDAGSVNPFREVPPEGSKNYYTAWLVFSEPPATPAENTSYVGLKRDGETTNHYLMNLLRLYATDEGDGANSGGVPLPALTIYNAAGEVTHHFDECDLYAEGNPVLKTEMKFPQLPIADHRGSNPPRWNNSSNFDAPSDTLANADAQYLNTFYSERFGDLMVVRAKYMTAPDTRDGEPHSVTGKDVRFYTLCNYNIWAGSAINCILDNSLALDDDGFYTLVISRQQNMPANLEAQSATWMDWGPYLDGQLTWRFVFRENPLVVEIAQAVMGRPYDSAIKDYVPVAIPCNRSVFEHGGWKACQAAQ